MGCLKNGPTSLAVMPIATPVAIAMDSVAPGVPNLDAAQISAGNTTYVTGSLVDTAKAPSVATVAISRTPSALRSRRHAPPESLAHASTRGTTTNAPATSPSHHVRQNVGASPA